MPSLEHRVVSKPPHVQDIGWLKSVTKLPILLKGVLTAEDGISFLTSMFSSFLWVDYSDLWCH